MGDIKNKSSLVNELTMENGYVFYNRLNDDDAALASLWKRVYAGALDAFEGNVQFFNIEDSTSIANSIIAQGRNEQQKERNLLYKFFGINMDEISIREYPKYINKINEIIGLKDDYKNLLALMQQGRKTKTGKTKNNEKDRAYSAMAYFESYLNTAIKNRMDKFFRTMTSDKLMEMDRNAWTEKVRSIMELSIEDAIEKMSNQTDIIGTEEAQVWQKAINLLKSTETQFNQLKSDIFKRYNLDNVIDELWIWKKEKKDKGIKSNKGLSTKIKKSFKMSEIGYRSVNGLLEEYISAALPASYKLTESGAKATGAVMKSNIAKTDNIVIFSTEGEINDIAEILNTNLDTSTSLTDANKIITDFYNQYISKLNDGFIIYENSKAYSLGSNFRGFHSGGVKPLNTLPAYLDSMGIGMNGQELVYTLYNTINGAIGEGKGELLKKDLSLQLSKAMANFMFDDWSMIGTTTNNAIHMFTLDEIKIPLSYLLIATGEAMLTCINNSESYFKISFNIKPDTILYKDRIGSSGDTSFDKNIGILGYWDNQRQAMIASTFSVSFLSNFKSLIKSLAQSL